MIAGLVFSSLLASENREVEKGDDTLAIQIDNVINGLSIMRNYDADASMSVIDCGQLPTPAVCPSRQQQYLYVSFLNGPTSPADNTTLVSLEWEQIQGGSPGARHEIWRTDVRNDN